MPEMNLPNLDYAFLADFAKVDASGKLTSVGASFTHLTAATLPTSQIMSVAGRVRVAEESGPLPLLVRFIGPDDSSPTIEATMSLARGSARPYEGRVGVLFTMTTLLPLSSEGLHEVHILLNGEEVRRLAFFVEAAPAPS